MRDDCSFVAMVAKRELARKQKAYDRKRKEKKKGGEGKAKSIKRLADKK